MRDPEKVIKMIGRRFLLINLSVALLFFFSAQGFAAQKAVVVPIGEELYIIPVMRSFVPQTGLWKGDQLEFIVTAENEIVGLRYSYDGNDNCSRCKFSVEPMSVHSESFRMANNHIGFRLNGEFRDERTMSGKVTVGGSACLLSNRLLSASANADECIAYITAGQIVSGSWTKNCLSTNRAGRYARYYVFHLPAAAQIQIDLESSSDTYMFLLSGAGKDGEVLESNDDGGLGLNSRISQSLPAGNYTIEATTFADSVTGNFTVTFSTTN
jgi:hypothetical protein